LDDDIAVNPRAPGIVATCEREKVPRVVYRCHKGFEGDIFKTLQGVARFSAIIGRYQFIVERLPIRDGRKCQRRSGRLSHEIMRRGLSGRCVHTMKAPWNKVFECWWFERRSRPTEIDPALMPPLHQQSGKWVAGIRK
jgi:hypothetical protein